MNCPTVCWLSSGRVAGGSCRSAAWLPDTTTALSSVRSVLGSRQEAGFLSVQLGRPARGGLHCRVIKRRGEVEG